MNDPFSTSSEPDPGPWFECVYEGECDSCGERFEEGDLIRADGSGGWEAEACCG